MSKRPIDIDRALRNWMAGMIDGATNPEQCGVSPLSAAELAGRVAFVTTVYEALQRQLAIEESKGPVIMFATGMMMELFGRCVGTGHDGLCSECIQNNLQMPAQEFMNGFAAEAKASETAAAMGSLVQ